jgi:uncharacterized protein YlzI (FlbEa/FlbD family)
MSPLVTYQFHKFTDPNGMQHVVKDSEVIQIEWRDTDPVGNVVLANGSTISASLDTIHNLLLPNLTIDLWHVDSVGVDGKRHHRLNIDRIDHIEWLGSDPEGVITLSNGNNIIMGMNALIQVIEALTERTNP